MNKLLFAVAILMISAIPQVHAQSMDNIAPIQECYTNAEVYKSLIISRLAGLTLEETQLDNEFDERVTRWFAEQNGYSMDDAAIAQLEAMTIEVYALDSELLSTPERQANWVISTFDECVSHLHLSEPPEPNNQQLRMIPDIET